MDVQLGLAAVCVITAFMCAFWLSQECLKALERNRLRAAVGSDLASSVWVDYLLRNGVASLMPISARLCRVGKISSLLEQSCRAIESRGRLTNPEAFCSVLFAVVFIESVVMSLLSRSLIGGLLTALLMIAVFSLWVQMWTEKRSEALRAAVPDALKAMEACTQTGLSLEQMLGQVAKEVPDDLGILFQKSAHILQMGGSSSQALECLRHGSNVPEIAFVAVALDVQHQTGGSLRQVLLAAREMVEGELSLRRHIRVQTAQAKLSARVVTVMPFILAVLLSMVSPDFLSPFFSSVTGLATLAFALAMQLVGVLIVRQMLRIDE